MLAQSGARVKASDPAASVRYDDGSVREFALGRLRLADFGDSVPWRQVRSLHGQAHYSGSYASATTGGFVVYESRLELARLLLADFDPHVQGIYAQPFLLVARVGGRVRRHVPDFLLVSAAGTARLVNVKPAARLQDPKVAEALAWPGVLAERHGWEYEVWSGGDVTVLENIRFLAGYRRPGVVPAEQVERARECVRDGEQLADAELRLAGGRARHEARPALLALLWSGRLVTDLTRPLSGESVLRRPA
jgi:hypothetical protein